MLCLLVFHQSWIISTILFCSISQSVYSMKYGYTAYDETDSQYWYEMARADLRERLDIMRPLHHRARNVIIFLGDGMGISTITASRILKGQLKGHSGEEESLEFDRFPHSALIKTYNIDRQVPDSAGTATAYLTGVKANFYTLGVTAKVAKDNPDCELVKKSSVDSVLRWALDAGKSTGIVTTTRVTHATPAAAYAHSQNRDWEYDIDESVLDQNNRTLCKDIARQLIEDEPGRSFQVILGGGRYSFMPDDELDPKGMMFEGKLKQVYGKRRDGRNLINEWLDMRRNQIDLKPDEYAYVNDSQSLHKLDFSKIRYLMGLFNHTHMEYEKLRDLEPNGEPSLSEMTEAAIRVLSKNPQGFVLLVEGGRIDHAHHDGFATMALHETVEFDRAIRTAKEMLPMEDTLMLVTADHSHSLVINGYPTRGNKIQDRTHFRDSNDVPYTTLMYANGPGYRNQLQRIQMVHEDLFQLKYRVHSAIYMKESNHAGEDVAVFAIGPMAHLFGGTHEQSYIAHVMAFAACIGRYQREAHCTSKPKNKDPYEKLLYISIPGRPAPSVSAARSSANFSAKSFSLLLNLIIFLSPMMLNYFLILL